VNAAVPDSELDAAVAKLADAVAGKPGAAVTLGKRAFYRQMELGLDAAYDYASDVMADNAVLADAGEGIDAFMAKRTPVWKHK
jgi:enoyl-CoA hydratase/carnithine racemase